MVSPAQPRRMPAQIREFRSIPFEGCSGDLDAWEVFHSNNLGKFVGSNLVNLRMEVAVGLELSGKARSDARSGANAASHRQKASRTK